MTLPDLRAGRLGGGFQALQKQERMFPVRPAHLWAGEQRGAYGRPFGQAEQPATQGFIQVGTGHPGRLSAGQARQGAADGRGDAAGGATRAAIHQA